MSEIETLARLVVGLGGLALFFIVSYLLLGLAVYMIFEGLTLSESWTRIWKFFTTPTTSKSSDDDDPWGGAGTIDYDGPG